MQTRSSSRLASDQISNPTSSTNPNPKGRNHRRSKQRIKNYNLEEHFPPVVTMADQRTMAELLCAPTEGYAEAIMVPSILTEQFKLKHSLINMRTTDQFFGLEKDNPHDHIRGNLLERSTQDVLMIIENKSKKQAQIEQDEAYARELEAELNLNINWNEVIEQAKRKEKQDNVVMRYQALKRKPQTEAQARKNMMVYLKNMAGFKMNFFKGMTYNEIRPIFEKHFNSIFVFLEKGEKDLEEEASKVIKRKSETSEEKVAKKQKLDEEVKELKIHLQIVSNDEDDVYTEATPLALKVLVVDYQIHTEHNTPYYKIIRADGTHQLFLSFISLLRNFDREDLEMLWKIVQERFASSEPKNFSDDFLLNTVRPSFM
nr:reverse transcriptase domain-containing protein [Tanacetum cinerariifolium]